MDSCLSVFSFLDHTDIIFLVSTLLTIATFLMNINRTFDINSAVIFYKLHLKV